jgi:DNA-binding response OmpR family regulator
MNKRVLIVEDEVDIREAMAEALSDAGYEVLQANNGQVGLIMALSQKPDAILLDIRMPVMDGHEMLRRLRVDAWGKKAKVIMLTSMDDATNIAHAHEENIADYIIKAHVSLEEVVTKVRMVAHL